MLCGLPRLMSTWPLGTTTFVHPECYVQTVYSIVIFALLSEGDIPGNLVHLNVITADCVIVCVCVWFTFEFREYFLSIFTTKPSFLHIVFYDTPANRSFCSGDSPTGQCYAEVWLIRSSDVAVRNQDPSSLFILPRLMRHPPKLRGGGVRALHIPVIYY